MTDAPEMIGLCFYKDGDVELYADSFQPDPVRYARFDRIATLEAENADARAVLDRIDVIAEVADAAPLCMGEIRELIKMHRAALGDRN